MPEGVSQAREKVGEAVDTVKSRVSGQPPSAEYAEGWTEKVRSALRAFGEGDVDSFLDHFDDEAEWVAPSGGNFPGGGSHTGRDEIGEHFVATVKRSYTEFGFNPTHFLQADREPWVVVVGSFVGSGVKGVRSLDVEAVQIWEFGEEQLKRVRTITDSAAYPEQVSEDEARELEKQEEEGSEEDEQKGDEKKDG